MERRSSVRSKEARLLLEEKASRSVWAGGQTLCIKAKGLGKWHTIVRFVFREILCYLNMENVLKGARLLTQRKVIPCCSDPERKDRSATWAGAMRVERSSSLICISSASWCECCATLAGTCLHNAFELVVLWLVPRFCLVSTSLWAPLWRVDYTWQIHPSVLSTALDTQIRCGCFKSISYHVCYLIDLTIKEFYHLNASCWEQTLVL